MSSGQPSQASTGSAAIPTGQSLEAVIGNVTYQLPSQDEDPIEVLLSDGSLAQYFQATSLSESDYDHLSRLK
jgi:hypothetical protein